MHKPAPPQKLAREALELIAGTDAVDAVLDPQRAVRVAREALAALSAAPAEPATQFDDPRVQTVYSLLCNTEDAPPPEQHWEGWIARRIVDALSAAPAGEPAGRMTEQQAALLNQAHDMLLGHADEQRQRGNDSVANGAECSADTVLKLAAAWAAQPVATDKDSLTVAPAGRLHADGYFTWHRRDGYVLDRRLPCDFYLTPAAAPSPVGLVPLTLDQIDSMEWGADCIGMTWGMRVAAVRAVERAHKIGGE